MLLDEVLGSAESFACKFNVIGTVYLIDLGQGILLRTFVLCSHNIQFCFTRLQY
jgi:hypothetical protein